MEDIEIVTVSFRLHKDDVEKFDDWFSFNYNVIKFSHFKDTPRMFDEDKIYRNMLKQKKAHNDSIMEYRNKNNHKYLDDARD
tara:strand:- start:103 stop:348 length:246 start_codon:yes stop_codon:yes gene_type:complete